ncbi:MAG TPA: InlB B-repeat-containing protein [Acidimicrobiales bacterium]
MSWRTGLAKFTTGVVVLILVLTATIIASPLASAAPITQVSPTSGTTDVVGSATFTAALAADPSFVGVTFANATLDFTITPSGVLHTPGTLTVAGSPYVVTGTDTDPNGDTGTWTYTLSVTSDTIVQTSPTSGTINVVGSAAFSDTLAATSGFVGPVNFSNPSLSFTITSSGVLSTPGTLSVANSPYVVTGTDADAYGDTGTWTYSLTVTPDTIVQGPPTSGSTNANNSATFTSALTATSGFHGPVTFATATSGFTVTGANVLSTTGTLSASNSPYTVTGTDTDTYGDSGTWTYSLSVTSPVPKTTTIVQTSPTTGSVAITTSAAFTSGPIAVQNNTGPVTFVTTKSTPGLTVSASGLISTTGTLAVGAYSASGTDSDVEGDSGTWRYTLNVTAAAVVVTVTFDGNGGTGTMKPESRSGPTALSLNRFTRARHTFIDWNTSANGSGVNYANGAVFLFGSSTTLFAQWKSGRVPSRTITFAANGGIGSTASEIHNTPTVISANHFRRAGYTFVNWNSSARGSGRRFEAGATYPFKKSITLYAQWKKVAKKPSPVVIFVANRGIGTMAVESHRGPTRLTPNHFRRAGYTFINWNTVANGSGSRYSNKAIYTFTASTTLFAQWKKNKKIVPPPPKITGPVVGPFARGSSTLTPLLENQIQNIADEVKAKGNTQIALLGYGNKLNVSEERNGGVMAKNTELGRARDQSVAAYLEGRLGALGLKGWTISVGVTAANPDSSQYETGLVIVTLS